MAQNARLQGLGLLVLYILLNPVMTTAQEPALNLLPLPRARSPGRKPGSDSSFSVAFTGHSEPGWSAPATDFLRQLARQTGLPLALKPARRQEQRS